MDGYSDALDTSSMSGELLIKIMPNRMTYVSGDALDLTGIQVWYVSAGGWNADVTHLIDSVPKVGQPVTNKTIVIEYHNIYTYFDIDLIDVVPWSTGTTAEIVNFVDKMEGSLANYWACGQERTVTLKDGTTKQFVLVDSTLQGIVGANERRLSFACAVKDSMGNRQHHNSNTNVGGWRDSDIRTWCNGEFMQKIPDDLLPIFKPFTWKQGEGGGSSSGLIETTDTFAIPTNKQEFGAQNYSYADEAALYNQFEYYKNSANRVRSQWLASPYSGNYYSFCCVDSGGSASDGNAYDSRAVVPFGCI